MKVSLFPCAVTAIMFGWWLAVALSAQVPAVDEKKSKSIRPTVIAKLVSGEHVEGELERFDDGEYWLRVGGERRKLLERELSHIEFHVLAAVVGENEEEKRIRELVARFFMGRVGSDGRPRGIDTTLTSELAAIGPEVVEPLLEVYVTHDNDYQAVGEVLKQIGPPAFPLLVEAVRKDPDRTVRFPVWYALRECGLLHSDFVQGLLKDRDPRIRLLAMDVFYSWSTTSGVKLPTTLDLAFIQTLDDPEEEVRAQVPLILGRIGLNSDLVLPVLFRTMEDERYATIRSNSVIALAYIGRELKEDDPVLKQVILALTKAIKDDPNELVRSSAAIHLGEFGSKAASALPALHEATNDKIEKVRESAREAITKIEDATGSILNSRPKD